MAIRRRPPWWGVAWILLGIAWVVVECLRHKPIGIVVALVFLGYAIHRSTRVPSKQPTPTTLELLSDVPVPVPVPKDLRLPDLRLLPAVSPWRWLGIRLGLPIVAFMALGLVLGIARHNSAEVSAIPIASAVILVIFGIEWPLILRFHKRKRARMLAAAPPGSLFAGVCVPFQPRTVADVAPDRVAGLRAGEFILGVTGISFVPPKRHGSSAAVDLTWAEISRLTVKPINGLACRVEVLAGGVILGWKVSGASDLRAAIDHLRQHEPRQ